VYIHNVNLSLPSTLGQKRERVGLQVKGGTTEVERGSMGRGTRVKG